MKVFIALCLVFVAAAFAAETTQTREKRDAWGPGSVYAPGWAGPGAWAAGNPWGLGGQWADGRWAGARGLGWNGGWNRGWNGAWNGAPTAIVAPTVWGNVGAPGWNPHAQPWW